MKMEMRAHLQAVIRNEPQIQGFSYAFVKLLLKKIKELRRTRKILYLSENREDEKHMQQWENNEINDESAGLKQRMFPITPLVEAIIAQLEAQLKTSLCGGSNYANLEQIDELISTVGKFLAIFEEQNIRASHDKFPQRGKLVDTARIARETLGNPEKEEV